MKLNLSFDFRENYMFVQNNILASWIANNSINQAIPTLPTT
jgi:hypothetical protein